MEESVWNKIFREALERPCEKITYEREEPPNQKWIPRFIIYDAFNPPGDINLDNLKLRITGLVGKVIEVHYRELLTELPCVDLMADFHCVTGWSVRRVTWRGIRTRDLLRNAEPRGDYVLVWGLDGYTTNLPIDALLEEHSIVAYAMGGRILPRENGFPMRLVVPSRYGWKSAKYLSEIEVLDKNVLGYWEMLGYHDNGDPWLEERFRYQGMRHLMRRGTRVIR